MPAQKKRQKIIEIIILPIVIGIVILLIEYRITIFIMTPAPTPTLIVPLTVSPKEMTQWYRSQSNQLQADEAARTRYYKEHVQWTGIVEDVWGQYDSQSATVHLEVDEINVNARFADKTKVSHLIKGETLAVICRIDSLSSYSIDVDECRALSSPGTIDSARQKFVILTPTPFVPLVITPQALIKWYNNFDTELQAENNAKIYYYGKQIQWTGTVDNIMPGSGEGVLCRLMWTALMCTPALSIDKP